MFTNYYLTTLKTILPILGMLLLFTFCQKSDDEIYEPNTPTEKAPDDIIYQDLNSNLILHPVDSFGSPYQCSKPIPIPRDSVETINLDVNGDGVDDFKFIYYTYYMRFSTSNPCRNHHSGVRIDGLNPETKIAGVGEYPHIKVFDLNDTIGSELTYSQSATVFMDIAASPANYYGFEGTGYVGIKLPDSGYGWMKVSFDGSTFTFNVMEYALNNTLNSSIMAGQVE